ncbi:MAG: hypothetical protein OEZ13_11255 [Spirochaetia bacterium]|nr:hypothetical protein [Spirochaetia bacterium]
MFIEKLFNLLPRGGWLALVDISCFISGNMSPGSKYFDEIQNFEFISYLSDANRSKNGNVKYVVGKKI